MSPLHKALFLRWSRRVKRRHGETNRWYWGTERCKGSGAKGRDKSRNEGKMGRTFSGLSFGTTKIILKENFEIKKKNGVC